MCHMFLTAFGIETTIFHNSSIRNHLLSSWQHFSVAITQGFRQITSESGLLQSITALREVLLQRGVVLLQITSHFYQY